MRYGWGAALLSIFTVVLIELLCLFGSRFVNSIMTVAALAFATGFTGAAFYPEGLGLELAETDEQSFGYSILNCANNVYIYDNDETLVGTECDNPVLLLNFSVSRMMSPINEINSQILRLKASDFSHGHGIERIMEREDEFGTIANAVGELQVSMENRNELLCPCGFAYV